MEQCSYQTVSYDRAMQYLKQMFGERSGPTVGAQLHTGPRSEPYAVDREDKDIRCETLN
jgi:hypothetical protein